MKIELYSGDDDEDFVYATLIAGDWERIVDFTYDEVLSALQATYPERFRDPFQQEDKRD